MSGYGSLPMKKRNPIISKLISSEPPPRPRIKISMPEDFRRVSAIIDIDIVPEAHRRVKLMKNGSEKPLGFYIRDGSIIAYSNSKMEKFPGIFISRLVPGGLAESTGLLAVNDEVLEVNGIEVSGKTLDQVTDMMVANSANLIITVKPANQKLTLSQERGLPQRQSQMSHISATSIHSQQSSKSYDSDTVIEHDEEDEVNDLVTPEGDKEATEDASLLTL